jgi:hypothetical protein
MTYEVEFVIDKCESDNVNNCEHSNRNIDSISVTATTYAKVANVESDNDIEIELACLVQKMNHEWVSYDDIFEIVTKYGYNEETIFNADFADNFWFVLHIFTVSGYMNDDDKSKLSMRVWI